MVNTYADRNGTAAVRPVSNEPAVTAMSVPPPMCVPTTVPISGHSLTFRPATEKSSWVAMSFLWYSPSSSTRAK